VYFSVRKSLLFSLYSFKMPRMVCGAYLLSLKCHEWSAAPSSNGLRRLA